MDTMTWQNGRPIGDETGQEKMMTLAEMERRRWLEVQGLSGRAAETVVGEGEGLSYVIMATKGYKQYGGWVEGDGTAAETVAEIKAMLMVLRAEAASGPGSWGRIWWQTNSRKISMELGMEKARRCCQS